MSLDLTSFDSDAARAVRQFWCARSVARQRQTKRGAADKGGRSSVTAGKNLDGFVDMISGLTQANGPSAKVLNRGSDPTLPGYFRATKNWDIAVTYNSRLVAVVELKSQVGPSFGNNLNNRVEEAVGSALDLLTAHREGAFECSTRPFLGYVFVLEDCESVLRPVKSNAEFPLLPEFANTSYVERYELLCRKLMLEPLYDMACLVLTPSSAAATGFWREQSADTSLDRFVRLFAARIAAEAGT